MGAVGGTVGGMTQAGLEQLTRTCGVACVAIGAAHALGGVRTVPGSQLANATVDSQERFYGAIFALYGFGWIDAAREPIDLRMIDVLSLGMLAGGAARLLSLVERGRPHKMYQLLTIVEFAAPGLFLGLVRSARRNRS